MNLNYTCICYYCGEIYQANRSTSKYCCPSHNSLYNANGPGYNKSVLNINGVYKDYNIFLRTLYNWRYDDVLKPLELYDCLYFNCWQYKYAD